MNRRLLLSLLALGLLFALPACDASDDDDASGDDDDSSGGALGDTVEYYFGSSTAFGLSKDWSFTTTYLVRRSLFPTESRMTEELFNTEQGTGFSVDLDVDVPANTFTLTFDDESYTGSGTLVGSPWAWTEWASLSTATDGSTVESTDTLTAQYLTVSKLGRDPSGEPEWSAGESYAVIGEAEWQERFDALPDPPE
jgi:hypothetical protein